MSNEFEIVAENISDTSEAPKGKNIYYRCTICEKMIPSQPKDNVGCECGNVFIDIDYFRLIIGDYKKFQAVRLIKR